jgi:serine/threonine-protein kinase
MVTGKKPFDGTSNYSIMSAHLQQQPVPPINISAGVPEALSQIILTSIAKEPGQRFQTAKAFASALHAVQPGATMSMVTPSYTPAAMTSPAATYRPPQTAAPAPTYAPPNYAPAPMAPTNYAPAPMAPPMPQPPVNAIPPVERSNRGLYMVLGSLVTIAVLAVAAIEGPKYFRTVANAPRVEAPVKTPPVVVTPPPAPVVTAPPAPVEAVVPVSTPATVPPATTPVAVTPVTPVRVPTSTPISITPVAKPPQLPQTTAQAPQVPVSRPQQAPPPVSVPAVVPAVNRELSEVREQYNELAVRTSSARASLDSMTQQIQRQGLGLRRDIIEAQTRLDYQMKEAMDSIRAGDVNGAREHLQFAQGNLQVIDKFLGH